VTKARGKCRNIKGKSRGGKEDRLFIRGVDSRSGEESHETSRAEKKIVGVVSENQRIVLRVG